MQTQAHVGDKVSATNIQYAMALQVTLASNFFGPLYLTHLLLDTLKQSAPSRVVFESSMLEQWGHVDWHDIGCSFALSNGYEAKPLAFPCQ